MRLLPRGPVAVASRAWTSSTRPMTTIVARVTFELRPLQSILSSRPEPPRSEDGMVAGTSGALVVHEPSDLAPMKARADVLVVGKAFSPGHPVTDLEARVIVGELEKAVRITGARRFAADGTPTTPLPFVEAPLDFTNAAGGPDTWNPVGVRGDQLDLAGESLAPSVLPLGAELGPRSDFVGPAGLGPVAPSWRPRRDRLPAGASGWLETPSAEASWPEGAETSFFQAALPDQQLSRPLRSGERIVLEHLHREHPRFVTSLPGLELSAVVVDPLRGAEAILMVADTLWIDTERALATLTYRAPLPTAQVRGRDVFLWLEGFDAHVAQDIAESLGETAQASAGKAPQVPFQVAAVPPSRQRSPEEEEFERLATGTIAAPSPRGAPVAMPFASPAKPPPPGSPPPSGQLAPAPTSPPQPALQPPLQSPPLQSPPQPPLQPPLQRATPGLAPPAAPALPPGQDPRPPAWAPSPAPSPPAAVQRFDTWKLHEEASRRSTEEPGAVAAAPGAALAAESPSPSPPRVRPRAIEVTWFESSNEIELARRSKVLGEQTGDEEDEWMSPGEVGDPLERARNDVARILRRSRPRDLEGLGDFLVATLASSDPDRPFVVLSGELAWSFDPRESLRAWIALGTPMSADPRVKDAIEGAERAMQEALAPIPDVLQAALERLRDVVRSIAKTIGPTPIDAAAERYLVEERGFGRRRVWGASRLRAHLHARGSRTPVPLYLPESAGWDAPLSQRFPARILGELRSRQDPTEACTVCLRAVAFGVEIG